MPNNYLLAPKVSNNTLISFSLYTHTTPIKTTTKTSTVAMPPPCCPSCPCQNHACGSPRPRTPSLPLSPRDPRHPIPYPPRGPRPSSHRPMRLRSSIALASRTPRSRRSTISAPSPQHALTPPPTFLRSCRCQEARATAYRRGDDWRLSVDAPSTDFVFVGRALDAAKRSIDLSLRPRGSSSSTVIPTSLERRHSSRKYQQLSNRPPRMLHPPNCPP